MWPVRTDSIDSPGSDWGCEASMPMDGSVYRDILTNDHCPAYTAVERLVVHRDTMDTMTSSLPHTIYSIDVDGDNFRLQCSDDPALRRPKKQK